MDWRSEDLGRSVSKDLGLATNEVTVISPYVTVSGIRRVKHDVKEGVGVTLIARFDLAAFVSGSTEIEALRIIADRTSGAVRLLPRLHAKIYARDWSSWWVGSANATGAGLQIEGHGNVEILGHFEGVNASLSTILNSIVRDSAPVSPEELEQLGQRVAELDQTELQPEDVLAEEQAIWQEFVQNREAGFMVQELPFSPTPTAFLDRLKSDGSQGDEPISHDCAILGIAGYEAGQEIPTVDMSRSFREIPIVRSLDEFLADSRSFGEVTAWLHDRCEDRPTPYRSEIKDLTARLLNWLLGLYPDRYRRERPVHSEVFVRVSDDWKPVDRGHFLTRPDGS